MRGAVRDLGQIALGPEQAKLAEGNGAVEKQQDRVQHPSTIVQRREFPLLGPYVGPRTPTERKLAEIWGRVLGMDQVSITDNFEELGGDSLLAVTVFAEIEKAFRIAVPIAALDRSRTIELLAPKIDELVARNKK